LIGLLVACATPGALEPEPVAGPVPVDEAYVLLHLSRPVFQAPHDDAPRGRLGVARQVDFPAELWPARVLARQGHWVQVRPVAAQAAAAHWSDPPPVIQALGLEVWVPEAFPVPVISKPVIQSWLDGSTIALSPGTPLEGSTALVRVGDATLAVTANPGFDERAFAYLPGSLTPARTPVGWLGVDTQLAFGTVGGLPLVRVPRAGRTRPVTRLPLEERASDGSHHWGILGSRTARVRTLLDDDLVRDSPGWSHAVTTRERTAAYDGWWSVSPGTPVTWSDGTSAGRVAETVRWDVEPTRDGERLCSWWQDLAGEHEPQGVTARWSVHASVLAQTGLQLCFPDSAVRYGEPDRD